jgi:hypothetical protein
MVIRCEQDRIKIKVELNERITHHGFLINGIVS